MPRPNRSPQPGPAPSATTAGDVIFDIVGLRPISASSKLRAVFRVIIRGVGEIDAQLFDVATGAFVKAASTQDARGAYRSTVKFSRDFAETVRDAVLKRLDEHPPTSFVEAPQSVPQSSALARGKRNAHRTRAAAHDHAAAFLAAQDSAFERAAHEFDDDAL